MTDTVDIIWEQILSWHPVHYSHQRVSQSMAHLTQEGETFVLVGSEFSKLHIGLSVALQFHLNLYPFLA